MKFLFGRLPGDPALETESTPHGSEMIVRQDSPANLEFPFHTLSERLTPSEQFYVRSHFPVPELNAADWCLQVGGLIERPLRLTLADLRP